MKPDANLAAIRQHGSWRTASDGRLGRNQWPANSAALSKSMILGSAERIAWAPAAMRRAFLRRGISSVLRGMGVSEAKHYKGIPPSEELLDRVGPLELAAHDFRIKLTEERLNRDTVTTEV